MFNKKVVMAQFIIRYVGIFDNILYLSQLQVST